MKIRKNYFIKIHQLLILLKNIQYVQKVMNLMKKILNIIKMIIMESSINFIILNFYYNI